jgi:hypothetical protein
VGGVTPVPVRRSEDGAYMTEGRGSAGGGRLLRALAAASGAGAGFGCAVPAAAVVVVAAVAFVGGGSDAFDAAGATEAV